MKIKVTQFDELTRSRIARTLVSWAKRNEGSYPVIAEKYRDMAQTISHGELLLCEYVYPEQEEGGHHGEKH